MILKTKLMILVAFATGTGAGVLGNTLIVPEAQAQTLTSCYQHYPNIPGRVLLEDDKMVVQKFTFPPGLWEGVHAHPPHQVYIMMSDTTWTVRYGDRVTTGFSPAGEVGFYGPVELSEDHESVNSGQSPAEVIWVTLKEGCAA